MNRYRIENIEKVYLNGKLVKTFKAFKLNEEETAYIFCGQFSAPARTANKYLELFIV
jgi:hypothetical protein